MLTKQQVEAFEKFKQLKVGALFMSMGTGKTRTALELVKYNDIDLLIYLIPFSFKHNVKSEFEKWGYNGEHIIMGYETLQSSDKQYLELLDKMQDKRCFIIADESIFIKNDETKRFKRACDIRSKCEYALILNGTPLTKNEWDLYNQMYFLSPLIFDMNRSQFLNTFFNRIDYKKAGRGIKTFYKFSKVNADALYKLIEPYIFKVDLQFDKKVTDNKVFVNSTDDSYYNTKNEYLDKIKEGGYSSDIIINMLTQLNVIASCDSDKNKKLAEYVDGKRVIVFCNYIDELYSIANNIDCYIIRGGTSNRSEIIEQFRNDSKPLLITLGTGAYSLNLQFCNEVVFSSLSFDYGAIEQAKGRIKRIGQDKDVTYTYFLSNFKINNLILDCLEKKENLKELINSNIIKKEVLKEI